MQEPESLAPSASQSEDVERHDQPCAFAWEKEAKPMHTEKVSGLTMAHKQKHTQCHTKWHLLRGQRLCSRCQSLPSPQVLWCKYSPSWRKNLCSWLFPLGSPQYSPAPNSVSPESSPSARAAWEPNPLFSALHHGEMNQESAAGWVAPRQRVCVCVREREGESQRVNTIKN